jgi:hypothetical protein
MASALARILTVVVALHAILVEPFLGASRKNVSSVQTVYLSGEDACPVAGDNCSGHVRHRRCAHELFLWLWIRCSRPRLHPRREGVGVVWVAPVAKADAYRIRVGLGFGFGVAAKCRRRGPARGRGSSGRLARELGCPSSLAARARSDLC